MKKMEIESEIYIVKNYFSVNYFNFYFRKFKSFWLKNQLSSSYCFRLYGSLA